MKKLFTNYNFDFSKNDKKLLTTFCKQTLKQVEGDNRYFAEAKTFNALLTKLSGSENAIKLTKEELTKLKFQLEHNVKYLNDQIKKSWFIKKWMYRSMASQYENILETHFRK
jgi:phosphotransferase system IIB component